MVDRICDRIKLTPHERSDRTRPITEVDVGDLYKEDRFIYDLFFRKYGSVAYRSSVTLDELSTDIKARLTDSMKNTRLPFMDAGRAATSDFLRPFSISQEDEERLMGVLKRLADPKDKTDDTVLSFTLIPEHGELSAEPPKECSIDISNYDVRYNGYGSLYLQSRNDMITPTPTQTSILNPSILSLHHVWNRTYYVQGSTDTRKSRVGVVVCHLPRLPRAADDGPSSSSAKTGAVLSTGTSSNLAGDK